MLLLTGLRVVVLLSLVRVEGQRSLKVFGVLCNGGGGRKGDEIKHLTLNNKYTHYRDKHQNNNNSSSVQH